MKVVATATATAASVTKLPSHHPAGKLDWRALLKWLREDDLITKEDAEQTRTALDGLAEVLACLGGNSD